MAHSWSQYFYPPKELLLRPTEEPNPPRVVVLDEEKPDLEPDQVDLGASTFGLMADFVTLNDLPGLMS